MVVAFLFFAITFAVFQRCSSMDVPALLGLLLGLFGGGNIPGMGSVGPGTAPPGAINGSGGLANASYGVGQNASGLPTLLLSLLGALSGQGLGLLGVAVPASGTNGTNRSLQLPPVQIYASGCGEFGIHLPGFDLKTGNNETSGNKTFYPPSRFGPGARHEGVAPIMPPNATFAIYKSGCGQFRLPNKKALEILKNGSSLPGHEPTDKRKKAGKPGDGKGPDFITLLLSLLGAMQGTGGMGPHGAVNGTLNGSGEHGPSNASHGMGTGPPAFLLPLLGLLGQTHLPNGTNQTSGLRLPPFFMHASGCGEFGFYFPGLDPGRRTNGTYGNGTEREEDGSFVSSYEKFVMYKSACGRGAEEEHEKNPAIVPEAKETPPHKTTTEATTTTSPTTTTTPSTTTTTTATTTTTTTATTTAPKSTRAPWPKPNCANSNLGNGLREVFLDTHNSLRGKLAKGQTERSRGWGIAPPSSLMHRMMYSCDAESFAQQEANACKELPAHTHPGYKANRHFTSAANMDQAARIAMQSWWSQLAQFGMRSNMVFQASELQRGDKRVMKWSKMAWWNNRYLGCAVRKCGGRFFVVCMYSPGGNNINGRVYPIGAVCSGCPAGKCDGQALCRM